MALGNKNAAPAAAAKPRSKYDAIATTLPTERGNYIQAGFHGLLRINSFRQSTGVKSGPMFVGSMNVIHTFSDSSDANPVGQEVSEVLLEKNVAFMSRMRGFLDAAGGLTQEDWNAEGGDAIVKEASGEGQPLAGAVVEARATAVIKQIAQNKPQSELLPSDTYTRVDYLRRVPAAEVKRVLTPEEIAAFVPDIDAQIAAEA